jgi:hypothetical protein
VVLHVLIAVHEVSQFDPHSPLHTVLLAQLVVHPLPQVMSQVLSLSHEKVTPLGAEVTPASGSPPRLHVAPAAHAHASVVQLQSPTHVGMVERPHAAPLPMPRTEAMRKATDW